MDAPKFWISGDKVQGQVIGDSNLVIQHFTSGITALPTDYASRIQNFFIEYLGTPKRPVPFGGRKTDLARLDDWLDDHNVPPYLLLVAPAGRGKSALLVRWCQQLLMRNDLVVAFLPVSIRFRTNLASVVFAALTARLASLHDEKVTATPDTPLEVWRGLMTDYLARPLPKRRRLLLILDGIDEAVDWEVGPDLFPLDPPPGLRIILTARYFVDDTGPEAWLRRIGWEQANLAQALDLSPLTYEGVADVLNHMNFPLFRLGGKRDIVAELHRLSEGDPLLVRLYVDDLWDRGEGAARLLPKELSTIRPGLQGYFDRWWEDQRRLWGDQRPLREPAVRAILNLLACALGPLSREALLRLAPSEIDLSTWALEEALSPLKRFVIGDGRQQGYTFSHPRLGAYFYEQLTEREQEAVESYFLAWGGETIAALNEGQLPPERASSYVVQYYGAHLERARRSAKALLSLVSNGWRRAWEALEGADAGFLNDIAKAWRSAEQDNEKLVGFGRLALYLRGEVHCALCLASVNSLATNIPPVLLVDLVRRGVWTPAQGLSYARQVPDLEQRARALALLRSYLPNPLKMEVQQEALETIRSIEDKNYRAGALIELIPSLSEDLKDDWLREALGTAWSIEDEISRAEVLINLISQLAEMGYVEEALKVVRAIKSDHWRAESLVRLTPFLSETLLREALRISRTIDDEERQAELLTTLIPRLAEVGYPQEALVAVAKIRYGKYQAKALTGMTPFLPKTLLAETLNIALSIKREEYRAEAMAGLAPILPASQQRDIMALGI